MQCQRWQMGDSIAQESNRPCLGKCLHGHVGRTVFGGTGNMRHRHDHTVSIAGRSVVRVESNGHRSGEYISHSGHVKAHFEFAAKHINGVQSPLRLSQVC